MLTLSPKFEIIDQTHGLPYQPSCLYQPVPSHDSPESSNAINLSSGTPSKYAFVRSRIQNPLALLKGQVCIIHLLFGSALSILENMVLLMFLRYEVSPLVGFISIN